MTPFMEKLNEPQRQTLDRLRLALAWCSRTDVRIRKDGEYRWFEADWLRDALDLLCGPHPEIERIKAELKSIPPGTLGPEQAQRGPQ